MRPLCLGRQHNEQHQPEAGARGGDLGPLGVYLYDLYLHPRIIAKRSASSARDPVSKRPRPAISADAVRPLCRQRRPAVPSWLPLSSIEATAHMPSVALRVRLRKGANFGCVFY